MADEIAARLAAALDLIVNCDAFAEPVARESKRDPEAEAVRLQRIEDVLAAGRRALDEYRASGVTEAQATRCGYCAQDMVPGSECRTSDAAKSCEMYQRFAATVKVDASGVGVPRHETFSQDTPTGPGHADPT